MVTLTERTIMKSRSGVYSDTAENRRKHRVGQKYGAEKQSDDGEKTEKKETDPAKELEAVNKVIAAINEGKMNLPNDQIMVLVEKKHKLEVKVKSDKKEDYSKFDVNVKGESEAELKKNWEALHEKLQKERESAIDSGNEESKKIIDSKIRELNENYADKRMKVTREKQEEKISSKDSEKKEKPADELASAREELQRHKDKKDSWIAKYGKNSYETRLEQIKDNVERLKNKTRSEKEKKADEKNSKKAAEMKEKVKPDKASDPIYQIQQKKKEAAKKYDDKREEARQKFDKESDEIRSQIDKLYESDHPDVAKKRKELWNSLKEKTNKYDEETTKLKNEYEAEYQKLDEAEDKLYDQRSKEETSQVSSDTDKEDLREARRKLSYLQDNEERLIKRDGKEKYDERLKQAKDEVEKLKGDTPKEEPKSEPKQSEAEESYTRIKFDDVPNSGKINLKKYLSEKVRKGVDEKWSNIKNIPTENLKKMEKGLVNDLNKNFEAIKKSQRAELLYSIMKVKGELESRGKETSKEGSKESGKLSDLQSKVPGYMNMPEYKKYISAKSEVDNFGKVPSGGDKRQRYDELNEQLIEATKKYKEALKKKLTT